MKKTRLVPLLGLGIAAAVVLTGCSVPFLSAEGASPFAAAAASRHHASTEATPVTVSPGDAATSGTVAPASNAGRTVPAPAPAPAAPKPALPRAGKPVQPPFVSTPVSKVAGLTAAIAAAPHPSLALCGGDLSSILVSASDLRGTGTTQYLTDTTCSMATGSTPDEIAIYQTAGGKLTRSSVIYQFAPHGLRLTAQPYLADPHTVVLTFSDSGAYQLVRITPTGVQPGPVLRG